MILSRVDAVVQATTAYGPSVIKELLNEVIETGHGQQVRHNIARHLFSSISQHANKTTILPNDHTNLSMDEDSLCSSANRSCDNASAAATVLTSVSTGCTTSLQTLPASTCRGYQLAVYLRFPRGFSFYSQKHTSKPSSSCGIRSLRYTI